MEEVLNHKDFKKKLDRIPPHLQETFVSIMQKMCEKESEILLDFIGQSRQDMKREANEIGEEQHQLKSRAQILDEKRKRSEQKALDKQAREEQMKKEREENTDVKNTPLMELYFKQRARRKARSRGEPVSDDEDDVFDVTSESRLGLVGSTQSIPTPVVMKTMEELRDELFQNLNTADVKVQEERQRQCELLEFLKDVKSKKKTDKAHALLSEAKQSEQKVAESKEAQDRKLKEKLEEKKKKKHKRRNSYRRKSIANLEEGSEGVANGLDELMASEARRLSISKRRNSRVDKYAARKMSSAVNDDEVKIVDETKRDTSKRRGSRSRKSKKQTTGNSKKHATSEL